MARNTFAAINGARLLVLAGTLAWGCGQAASSTFVPGYTPDEARSRDDVIAPVEPTQQSTSSPDEASWEHARQVTSWQEVSRGNTLGHAFAGHETAVVSTRISDPALADVLSGALPWSALSDGATVSQLVLSASEPTRWEVAFVAERRIAQSPKAEPPSATSDNASGIAFYLVAWDGTIDDRSQELCASCHSQRRPTTK